MLLLGAVAMFEPVNGYQIRRELMSWQVDQWANINPGSIYHALTSLTEKGHLTRHDLVDNGRTVAVDRHCMSRHTANAIMKAAGISHKF